MNTNKLTAGAQYNLHLGDNLATLKNYPDNTFDSIVTDPPYFIDFLGKEWDSSKSDFTPLFKECLRVLKPGGYLLAFGAPRTYHKLAYSVENAGFEIRDQLMWLYSSGFPKAQDIGKAIDKRAGKGEETIKNGTNGMHGEKIEGFDLGSGTRCPTCKKDGNTRYSCDKGNECGMVYKPATADGAQWNGFKTALKPAHEPIVMARKPYKGSTIDNVLKNGLGAMNIDATRVEYAPGTEIKDSTMGNIANMNAEHNADEGLDASKDTTWEASSIGRYPSNVIGEVTQQKYFYNPTYNYRIKEGTDSIVINMIKEFLCKQNTSNS